MQSSNEPVSKVLLLFFYHNVGYKDTTFVLFVATSCRHHRRCIVTQVVTVVNGAFIVGKRISAIWGFHTTHKITNIGIIANFVFPYIYSFLLYLYHMILVNLKLDISGYKIVFQDGKLHWSSSFATA